MQRFLTTPDINGYFDFFSNIIVLKRYTELHSAEIKKAITWKPGDILKPNEIMIRALLMHEVTHFLDMTTTEWGFQYICRKLRAIKYLENPQSHEINYVEVFMNETAEIDMHRELLKFDSKVSPNSCDTLRHELVYTERFGTYLSIIYFQNETPFHRVPLSMLSMLEANATASEYLSEIACAALIDDDIERRLTEQDIERRFNNLLDDPGLLEYSVLLKLTKIHFSELTLRELLILVAALCRFSLDATDFGMASMANVIEASSNNHRLSHSISMELRRASQRQLLYFKSVLLMYGWMCEMNCADRNDYISLIKREPTKAIRALWLNRFNLDAVTFDLGRDFMPAEKQRWLDRIGVLRDAEIFHESFSVNAPKLDATSAGLLNLSDLKLMNVVLEDDTEIKMPNALKIDVLEYFDQNLHIFSMLEKNYRERPPKKFHIPLSF